MYPFQEIEKKWQSKWEAEKTFRVVEDPNVPKEKRAYLLDMFPYPSGAGLHVGHPEGYTATDIYGRYLLMNGYHVLHPMGFDSFGLPAENYAIKTGTHPRISTEKNIANFIRQIKRLGFAYDWDRMVQTHTPEYYRWTQWIFLQLYKKGLAYLENAPINWCVDCKTGLANEEVAMGRCDRCGAQVVRRQLSQWMLRITEYADDLLKGLDTINWSPSIKTMQENWIGKSVGANVRFGLEGDDDMRINVFTTRPDTLFGATYMVLAPEHELVDKIVTDECREAVEAYKAEAAKKSDLERTELNKNKTGCFTGAYGINPVNGRKLPIWVADYVLASYGFGAIMAVPAHDERDWEFAKAYDLPIIPVLDSGDVSVEDAPFIGDGLHINSSFIDGMDKETAIKEMLKWLVQTNAGERSINYKLRDWLFCRQRYWGEPIPLVHCESCGIVPIPEEELPLMLPEVDSFEPTDDGASPLARQTEWINTTCPECKGSATRDTNTMPQWAGSCWYYLRYIDPHNTEAFVDREKADYWMPVDLYVGGVEHAVLHLLYARFWHRVLFDLGYVGEQEPFMCLVNQGLITSFAYERANKTLVPVDEVDEIAPDTFVERATGEPLTQVVAKMSKSLKNVVSPDDVIDSYGADAMRLYEMFMGPLQHSKPWSTSGIQGVVRFLDRVWRASEFEPAQDAKAPEHLVRALHQTIRKVTADTAALEFNTAIAQMMTFLNVYYAEGVAYPEIWSDFILLLAPYAPHMCEELWERMGNEGGISHHPWPSFDEKLCEEQNITVVFQVNGKLRSKQDVPKDISREELQRIALEDERIKSFIEGKEPRKVIVVPGKLVNIVV